MRISSFISLAALAMFLPQGGLLAAGDQEVIYENRLRPIADARPLLGDLPRYVEPIREKTRFEAPILVHDKDADLEVRAWRFSYNARGIVEIPNRLSAKRTAVIVVHPWGIDDGQGWKTPEPAGVAFACTLDKNQICLEHMKEVINPFLKALRGRVGLVAYSLPGKEDPIRRKIYRSFGRQPTSEERRAGARELATKLGEFQYRGESVPWQLRISEFKPAADYFRQTTAGFENLGKDFNVFLVGDATLATFPACDTPRFATTAAVAFASLDVLITQMSWIRPGPVPRRNR